MKMPSYAELAAIYQEELSSYEEAKRIAVVRPEHEFFVSLAKLNCENAKAALEAADPTTPE